MDVSIQSILSWLATNQRCTNEQLEELHSRFYSVDSSPKKHDREGLLMLKDWLITSQVLTQYQADILTGEKQGVLTLGPYVIQEEITQGRLKGMYRAEHIELQFPLCIKLFRPTGNHHSMQSQLSRFQREARVSIQADHTHLVRTFQVGSYEEESFIAYEHLSGCSLEEMLTYQPNKLNPPKPYHRTFWNASFTQPNLEQVCVLLGQVALGLEELHQQSIVHRGVTPSNIWLTEDGTAKLMDFGLARDSFSHLDSKRIEGNELDKKRLGIVAPEEQHPSAKITAASDLYSLGCTFYHALTRPNLNSSETNATDSSSLPTEPGVNQYLDEVLQCLLSRDPKSRYPSAKIIANALFRCAADQPQSVSQSASPEKLERYLEWLDQTEGQSQTRPQTRPQSRPRRSA